MAQIINSTGDIKVMNNKGEIKWFCKKIIEDKQLMKTMKYEVVNAPDSFPPIENITTVDQYQQEVLNSPEIIEETTTKRSYKSRK